MKSQAFLGKQKGNSFPGSAKDLQVGKRLEQCSPMDCFSLHRLMSFRFQTQPCGLIRCILHHAFFVYSQAGSCCVLKVCIVWIALQRQMLAQ